MFIFLKKQDKKKGIILVQSLVFGAIAIIFISGLSAWGAINIKASKNAINKELAFNIAEAGVEYYRWHLAHDPDDYQDGTNSSGPYVHNYYNKKGDLIGYFSLEITPPLIGSTVVKIKSTGTVVDDSSVSSVVEVQLAKPSLAKYAVATNTNIRFGGGTEVFGPIHSNGGVRFDGEMAHNIVTSSKETYNDSDWDDCNEDSSFGVHTCLDPADPTPPAPVPDRSDIFEAGRRFPVPAIDFVGFTSDLASIKSNAQTEGLYFSDSGSYGYHIVLRNNDTFDLYRVTSLRNPNGRFSFFCYNIANEDRWGTWSINRESYIGNYDFPANGLVFVEDDVWVDGNINTARLTIASGRFPENSSTYTNIIINNDLLYTNYDGQDVVSLIAQGDIAVGLFSEDDLRIDAALVAQNGRVGRNFYYYWNSYFTLCGNSAIRDTVSLYGVIVTNKRYVFSWSCAGGSCWNGYANRNLIYDANLLYNPPPNFPITSDEYEIISWKKLK